MVLQGVSDFEGLKPLKILMKVKRKANRNRYRNSKVQERKGVLP